MFCSKVGQGAVDGNRGGAAGERHLANGLGARHPDARGSRGRYTCIGGAAKHEARGVSRATYSSAPSLPPLGCGGVLAHTFSGVRMCRARFVSAIGRRRSLVRL